MTGQLGNDLDTSTAALFATTPKQLPKQLPKQVMQRDILHATVVKEVEMRNITGFPAAPNSAPSVATPRMRLMSRVRQILARRIPAVELAA